MRAPSCTDNGIPPDATPAIVLIDPKFPHNVGSAIRHAACFGARQVIWTGDRVERFLAGSRWPREERLRAYRRDVRFERDDRPFDRFGRGVTPVAVEVREGSESLFTFEHPERAVYVFGPEDGSLMRTELMLCHRFVQIPSRHCLNLANAVSVVLYDRVLSEGFPVPLAEHRGFYHSGDGPASGGGDE